MDEPQRKSSPLLLIVVWLLVGLPAAWGIEQTVVKSIPLFHAQSIKAEPGKL